MKSRYWRYPMGAKATKVSKKIKEDGKGGNLEWNKRKATSPVVSKEKMEKI